MKIFVFVRAVVLLSIAVMFLAFMSFMLVKLLSAVSVEAQEPGCDTVAFLQMGGQISHAIDGPLTVEINFTTEDRTEWVSFHRWIDGEWQSAWGDSIIRNPAPDCQVYADYLVEEAMGVLNGRLDTPPIFLDQPLHKILLYASGLISHVYLPVIQGGSNENS